jgi:hypothetical protein
VSGVDEAERLAVAPDGEAARKRVAVETYVRNEAALRRTARRYSICSDHGSPRDAHGAVDPD